MTPASSPRRLFFFLAAGQCLIRPATPLVRPPVWRMVNSFGTSAGGSSSPFGPRDPQELLNGGRELLTDALRVANDVGLRTTMRRTLVGQRALLETGLELARELPLASLPLPVAGQPVEESLRKLLEALPPELAPRTLRKLFERLGATYVKLGQFIASSPTIFPAEFVLEFQNCLDATPTVDFATIKGIIEQDLGRPIDQVFRSVETTPLASASVAQVHAAVLLTGEQVVIKVQKPGVADVLQADLGFLAVAAKTLEFVAPELGRVSLANIVEDLRESMLGELDFTQEARNLADFRAFLAENDLLGVATAPLHYPAASSRKVLTMERLFGQPLTDLDAIAEYSNNPEQTLFNALNTWTLSVVACPFFHADVHAGNLLVLRDGRVGFIDFGIVGRIPPTTWSAIQKLAVGFGAQDFTVMAQALIDMGATSGSVDVAAFARDLENVVVAINNIQPEVVVTGQANGDITAAVGVDQQSVTRLSLEIVGVAERNGVKLPREFGILLKQVLYFDRYTRLLAPEVDVLSDDRLRLSSEAALPRGGGGTGPVIDVV